MKSMFQLIFKEKHFTTFSIANMISRFGDSIDMITLTWLTYELTHDASLSAIIFTLNVLPNVFIQPIGGVLVRRFNYKSLLVISDILRGTAILIAATLLYFNQLTFIHIMILTLVSSTIESFNLPASSPFVLSIVSKENYETCAGFRQGLCRLSELVGTGIAGTIITILGAPFALFIDAFTFIISAILTLIIPYKSEANSEVKIEVKSVFIDMKDGYKYLVNNKILLTLGLMLALANMIFVPFSSYFTAYASEYLLADVQYISVVMSVFSLANIVGAIFASKATKMVKPSKLIYFFIGCCPFINVIFAIGGSLSSPFMSQLFLVLFLAPIGVLLGIFSVFTSTKLMMNADKEYLSRIMSLLNAAGMALMPVISLLCSVLAIYFKLTTNFIIVSIPFFILIILFVKKFKLTVLD